MSRLPSTSPSAAGAFAVACAVALSAWVAPRSALAQVCCSGGSAVTPARLAAHEFALVGLQTRSLDAFGQYDRFGHFSGAPPGDSEYDFEEDVFGAVRMLRRGQLALLVPLVETLRATRLDGSRVGGGVGDVNVSVRYDFLRAGESRHVPGIGLLAGMTFPTGTPVERATPPLNVDTTGIGAFQGNIALALEQTFGPWLVDVTGMASARTARFGETLAPQITLLAAGAYTFSNDAALAMALTWAFEGDATDARGVAIPTSSKQLTTVTLSALWPFGDDWRLVGGLLMTPPVDALGKNWPAGWGITFTVVRSWS
jgi:hypothetical protein